MIPADAGLDPSRRSLNRDAVNEKMRPVGKNHPAAKNHGSVMNPCVGTSHPVGTNRRAVRPLLAVNSLSAVKATRRNIVTNPFAVNRPPVARKSVEKTRIVRVDARPNRFVIG